MKNSPLVLTKIFVALFFFGFGCADISHLDPSDTQDTVDALIAEKDDPKEFSQVEYFSQKEEGIKYFLGQYKDFPDPIVDPNAPLKIPNQDDVESLFKYLRKHVDSLDLGSPDAESIKKKLFMNEDGKMDLNRILNHFRFKPVFRDVSFSIENLTYNRAKGVPGIKPVRYVSMFKNMLVNDVDFDSVKFEDLDWSGSQFKNVRVMNSSFSRTLCLSCEFDNVTFDNSTAKDADFSFSKGAMAFVKSNLSYLKVTDSDFDQISFIDSSLRNSVFINSKNVSMQNVDSFNNVGASFPVSDTRLKNVGLIYKNSFPGGTAYKIHNTIRARELQPIKIEYGLEGIIDGEALKQEVDKMFAAIDHSDDSSSITEKLLSVYKDNKDQYPLTNKIDTMVQGYVKSLDSLIIPGGLDMEPYFYNKNISPNEFYTDQLARLRGKKGIVTEENPIRSMLEVLLLDAASKQQLPLLMICRGAHLYNIVKGGKMIENLPDVYDNVDFGAHLRFIEKAKDLSERDASHKLVKIFEKQGRDAVPVYGNHHQAVDPNALGAGLKTVLVWNLHNDDYIAYALYDQTYAPGAWLVQFHPEVKEELGGAMSRQLSALNTELYDSFFDLMDMKLGQKVPTETQEPAAVSPKSTEPAMAEEKVKPSAEPSPPAAQQPASTQEPSNLEAPTTTDEPRQSFVPTPAKSHAPVVHTRQFASQPAYVTPSMYAYPVMYIPLYVY